MSKMSICKMCNRKYAPCRGCEKDSHKSFYNFRVDFCSPECYQKSLEPIKISKPKIKQPEIQTLNEENSGE